MRMGQKSASLRSARRQTLKRQSTKPQRVVIAPPDPVVRGWWLPAQAQLDPYLWARTAKPLRIFALEAQP